MHHIELTGCKRSVQIKILFFLILLFFIGITYLESNSILDAIYFCIIAVLFIRFLFIKLYH